MSPSIIYAIDQSLVSKRDLLCFEIIACAIPIEIKAATVDDPPEEINKIGTPVIGIKPETPPRLINRCNIK